MSSLFEEHMQYAQQVLNVRDYLVGICTTNFVSTKSKYKINMELTKDDLVLFRKNIKNPVIGYMNIPYSDEYKNTAQRNIISDNDILFSTTDNKVLFFGYTYRERFDVLVSTYTEEQHFQDSLVLPEFVLKMLVVVSELKKNQAPGIEVFKINFESVEIFSKVLRYKKYGLIK